MGQQVTDPWFTNVWFNFKKFYPHVRDRYKEFTYLAWYSDEWQGDENAPYGADYTVTNSDEEVVFTKHLGHKFVVRWRGVDDSGETVPVGDYTVSVTAYDAEGAGHVATRQVTVAKGEVLHRSEVWGDGNDPGRYRKATRGTCMVHEEPRYGSLLLSCWGDGKFAKVTFTLNIPPKRPDNAEITRYSMATERVLCDNGARTKKVWKVDRDTIRASLKVTGRCVYRVHGAVMHYKWTKPI